MKKLIRITTVPASLNKLLEGQLAFMSKYYQVIAISSNKDELQEVGEKEGVETFTVKLTRKITPFRDVVSLLGMYVFFKREKPFIVHTHTPKAGTIGMFAAWLARVPNRLHTVAGLPLLEIEGNKRKVLNFVEKMTYKCATHIYPNSQGLKNIIIKEGFASSSKLKVIANGSSNGINTSYFKPSLYTEKYKENLKKELNISSFDFVFIFIGRLVGDKGINELVEVFCQLKVKYSDVKLLLVGAQESDLDPLEMKTIEQIAANTAIISLGCQNDVRPFLAVSDVLVFPSYREGFPNVVMQAGAMGLSSIVTNINGCNEIIKEGVNGKIIPPKDKNALYEAMEWFYMHRDNEVVMMEKVARMMIAERYEQRIIWETLLKEYQLLG